MTRNQRTIAAMLILGGVVLGILLTSSLKWTDSTQSQPRVLEGSHADVPEALARFQEINDAFITVAELAQPSVVTIASERVVRPAQRNSMPDDHPFREFFGDDMLDRFWFRNPHGDEFRTQGLGSGVIVSEDGYILTNNHVIDQAEEIVVSLDDDREFEATVVGADPESDIALLKIDADGLPAPRFGDSDGIRVGEWVIAVGSPFNSNLKQTVTAGIVSAMGRTAVGLVDFENFIQTDAAINPGNSGGALMNMRGELVGINTAIATRSTGSQGVGFAIPINMARAVMDDLLNEGHVVRGWLGVQIQSIDEDLAKSFNLDSRSGVLINDLTDKSPAERAGMERGDIVTEFEGVQVKDADHLQNLVAGRNPGDTVKLVLVRDGKKKRIDVELGERPSNPREVFAGRGAERAAPNLAGRLGLEIEPLTESLARELGYEGVEGGVVISAVRRGSVSSAKNIRKGDLVVEINQEPVASVEDVARALRQIEAGDPVLLLLRRGQTTFYTAVKMPADE